MEISSTTASAASTKSAATAAATTSSTDSAASAGDFQTFLTLLTTQMKNQDPLKPMDSTEFVSQLASFSAVEQQVKTNDRLQGILDAVSGGSPAGLAEWIGRDVQVAAKADYEGEPVEVAVTPHDGADRGVLVVTNDFGQVVARVPVAGDAETATWDGTDSAGNAAADGRYGFTLQSYQGDVLLGETAGKVFSTVREVRLVDGSPELVVADGTQVPLSEIGGVR
ncbi:MAG: flagellar hook capping FlgD N-terminal domain-containing protein [Amaricoccus sp.]